MKKYLLLGLCTLGLASAGMAETISVDNNGTEFYPLVKRFGVNVSAATPFATLQQQADAIKAINSRYVRVPNAWGNAGKGLYEAEDVTKEGNIDFTRIDEVVGILTANGASPIFVVSVPEALGGGEPNNIDVWGEINYKFFDHWRQAGITAPTYEIMPGYGNKEICQLNHEQYAKAYSAAEQAIQLTDAVRQHIDPRVFPGSMSTPFVEGGTYDQLVWDLQRGMTDPNNGENDPDVPQNVYVMKSQAVAVQINSQEELVSSLTAPSNFYDWGNRIWEWEQFITQLNLAGDNSTESSVGNPAVIAMLNFAKDWPTASGVTRVYNAQLLDAEDGTKGIISADGSKTPLYHALKLWNQMPLSSRKIDGLNTLKALASSDNNASAIVVWNEGASAENAVINFQNLPFTSGKLMAYGVDGSVTELGTVSSTSASASVSVPAGSAVFVFAENNSPVNYQNAGTVASNHHFWWIRYTEGWAWQYLDPLATTIVVGDATNDILNQQGPEEGNWGVAHAGLDMINVPETLYVDIEKQGGVKLMDPNSAVYFRIDFETLFEDGDYVEVAYEKPTLFYDLTNSVIDFTAGSKPDNYPYCDGNLGNIMALGNAHEVDFLTPGGLKLNLSEYAPEGWTGNIRTIAYLQNPGAHDFGGCMFSFRFRSDKETENAVREVTANKNATRIQYDGSEVRVESLSPLKGIEILDLSGRTIAATADKAISVAGLQSGAYVVVVNTESGITSRKIIK